MGHKVGAVVFVMAAVLSAFLLGFGARAWAEKVGDVESRAPTQEEIQRAKALFRRGKAFFADGRYREAANAFEDAYRLHRHKAIEYNLAVTHAMLGHDKPAVMYLRAFLRHEQNPPPLPEVLKKAQARVGVVVVSVKNAEGSIYVNGRLAGKGHAEKVVDPGRVVLEVRLQDRVMAHKELMVMPGRETVYEFATLAVPRKKSRHSMSVGSKQSRGVDSGTINKGTSKGRGRSFQRLHWAYFAAAAALTVGAAAGAAATGVMAKRTHDDYLADPTDASVRDKGKKLVTTTNALWGVTAGMAVTAVIVGVFTRWKSRRGVSEENQSVTVAPMITQGGAGLVLRMQR